MNETLSRSDIRALRDEVAWAERSLRSRLEDQERTLRALRDKKSALDLLDANPQATLAVAIALDHGGEHDVFEVVGPDDKPLDVGRCRVVFSAGAGARIDALLFVDLRSIAESNDAAGLEPSQVGDLYPDRVSRCLHQCILSQLRLREPSVDGYVVARTADGGREVIPQRDGTALDLRLPTVEALVSPANGITTAILEALPGNDPSFVDTRTIASVRP